MGYTFYDSPSLMLTSESVTEGHPDKLCDQVSDAVLDSMLEQDPMSRVACEAAVTTGVVFILGEITTNAYVDLQQVVRNTVREVGYEDSRVGFDWETCGVISSIKEQAGDIAQGVNQAHEVRASGSEDPYDLVGAGDQGIMIGFACDETEEYLPLTISLAHRLSRRLAELRKAGTLPYLRPDGKSQVTIEYEHGLPRRIAALVVSTQHDPDVRIEQIREDVVQHVVEPICPPGLLEGLDRERLYVNPTGRFVSGGPASDAGLTGRKIIVDTYGGIARHGGGAFSGKDPTKVDRLRRIRGAPRREERRRRRPGRPHGAAGLIRDRRRAADLDRHRDVRHRQAARGRARAADPRALRPPARRDHRPLRPAPADLPADRRLRALRPAPTSTCRGSASTPSRHCAARPGYPRRRRSRASRGVERPPRKHAADARAGVTCRYRSAGTHCRIPR